MAPVLHHLATSDTKSSPDMSTIKPYTSNTDSPQDTEKHSLPDLGDTGAGTHHGDTDANVPTISTVRMCFLTAAMLLTWFLGTASAASVTLLLPVMVQDLNSNDLEMQWVNHSSPLLLSKRIYWELTFRSYPLIPLLSAGMCSVLPERHDEGAKLT